MLPKDSDSRSFQVPSSLADDWQELVTPMSKFEPSTRTPTTEKQQELVPAGAKKERRSAPGKQDPIEIIRELRTTSDVVVHEGWDHDAQRSVAVYTLTASAQNNPAVAEAFWNRMRHQAAVDHGNIVSIYFLDKSAGRAMAELCEPAFAGELSRTGYSEALVREWLAQMLAALDYLHRQQKVHGQLQPAVLMRSEGGPFKLDQLSGREAGAELQLRPGYEKYVAPETLDEDRFGRVGVGVDLYALGMIALELLAGSKFASFFEGYGLDLSTGGDGWLRWKMSAEARLPSVSELLPKVDPTFAAVLDALLQKQVDQRVHSAAQALSRLGARQPALPSVPILSTQIQSTAPVSPTYDSMKAPSMQGLPQGSRLSDSSSSGPARGSASSGKKTWRERVDELFAEQNANKLAGGILLVTTFVAGLAFFETPPAKLKAGSEVTFEALEEATGPPSQPYQPEVLPAEVVEVTVAPPPLPPKPTPPPLPRNGRVIVTVVPRASWLRINGRSYHAGASVELSPGTHSVSAGRWDHEEQSQRVAVKAGQTKTVLLELAPREAPPRYLPVLKTSHEHASEADHLVEQIIEHHWHETKKTLPLSRIQQTASSLLKQGAYCDPRLLHALAALTVVRGEDWENVQNWYQQAVRASPVHYCWPQKGLVRALLMRGETDAALRGCKGYLYLASRFTERFPDEPRAEQFLADTAFFAGQVFGLAESLEKQSLKSTFFLQDLQDRLPQEAASLLLVARQQVVERHQQTATGKKLESEQLVRLYLGDFLAEEREALRRSLGKRSTRRPTPSVQVTLLDGPKRRTFSQPRSTPERRQNLFGDFVTAIGQVGN